GNVGLRAIETDVPLALLFRIIEGVGVEEGPDELTADVFQAELEVSVLVDGVVAAIESGCADVEALRRVTRGSAVSTESEAGTPSNMRDCVATLRIDFTRSENGGLGKNGQSG